jgi:hypothetical protein
MGLSGHKSESALRAYSKRLSEKKTYREAPEKQEFGSYSNYMLVHLSHFETSFELVHYFDELHSLLCHSEHLQEHSLQIKNGIETRHIMGLSGHKSESAVRAYSKRLSEKKTRQISDILSATVQETGNDESRISCTSTNTSASTKCHVSDFKSHSTSTCTSGAAGVQQHEESNSTNLPDFVSEDYVLAKKEQE